MQMRSYLVAESSVCDVSHGLCFGQGNCVSYLFSLHSGFSDINLAHFCGPFGKPCYSSWFVPPIEED